MKVRKIFLEGAGGIDFPANAQHKFIIELAKALGITKDDTLFIMEERKFNKELKKYDIVYRVYVMTDGMCPSFDLAIHTEEQKAINVSEAYLIEKYNEMREKVNKAKAIIIKGYLL